MVTFVRTKEQCFLHGPSDATMLNGVLWLSVARNDKWDGFSVCVETAFLSGVDRFSLECEVFES
jgi:hypothetical protein